MSAEEMEKFKKKMKEKQRIQEQIIREKLETQKRQSEEDSRWLQEEENKSEFPEDLSSVILFFVFHPRRDFRFQKSNYSYVLYCHNKYSNHMHVTKSNRSDFLMV